MNAHHFNTRLELAHTAATQFLDWALSQPDIPRYTAISGGRVSETFFSELAGQTLKRHASLKQIHFFWADERCVPPNHPESNYHRAKELLFEPLNISIDHVHRVFGEFSPVQAAHLANKKIEQVVPKNKDGLPELDLILLGMGEDGHTASLFPGATTEKTERGEVYLPVQEAPKPPPNRVTISYPAIYAAKNIWVLASGSGKEKALQDSLAQSSKTPLGKVLNRRKDTLIFTDI